MIQDIMQDHRQDANDNPAGGVSDGVGFTVSWQNGPLGRGTERSAPNGTFVETIIRVAIGRLQHYESSRFHCSRNAAAIEHLTDALQELEARTAEREDRGVEGTHAV